MFEKGGGGRERAVRTPAKLNDKGKIMPGGRRQRKEKKNWTEDVGNLVW